MRRIQFASWLARDSAVVEVRSGRDGARVYRARVYHRGRYVASRTFARKRDAQEWERRQVDGLRSCVWSDPGAAERPVQDSCDAWLAARLRERLRPNARSVRLSTRGSQKPWLAPRRYPFDRLRSGSCRFPPCAERREGRPINADHFVGVVGLAACFVPRLAPTTTVLGEPASPPCRGLERCCELAI